MQSNIEDYPTVPASTLEYHRHESMVHAEKAEGYLDVLRALSGERPDTRLNQSIGVHLKLADVHARLALAMSRGSDA